MTQHSVRDDDAAVGLAFRATLAVLPQQAQLIARLDRDARRAVIETQLDHLAEREVLSSSEADELRRRLNGEAPTDASATAAASPEGRAQLLTVKAVLASTLPAEPATDSFLSDLWDAAVTAVAVVIGEAIAGPAGGLAAGLAAHEWATHHPPETLFS